MTEQKGMSGLELMDDLLKNSRFESNVPKLNTNIKTKPKDEPKPKMKDIEINEETDSKDEIIKKLIMTVKLLRSELEEYKQYVDGTYCSLAQHNRLSDSVDKKLGDITERLEDHERRIDEI